jgi:hypothetical protein
MTDNHDAALHGWGDVLDDYTTQPKRAVFLAPRLEVF